MRLQMEVILIFAGIVKINYDWLVRLMPLKVWLADAETFVALHYFFTQNWFVTIAVYFVVILHIVGAPLLLFKRTRIYVFLIYCCFHILNDHVFQIGSFPWMSIAFTTIFFDPDWPKKIFKFFDKKPDVNLFNETPPAKQNIITYLMVIWVITQILIPSRYLLYPGNPSWTGEGQRFAWRMKLNIINGMTSFYVTDPETNQKQRVTAKDYLTFQQFSEMLCQPDMILQFAHHIHKVWTQEKGYKNVKVTVESVCSLNKRKPVTYINPEIDLAHVERNLKHNDWVLPVDLKAE